MITKRTVVDQVTVTTSGHLEVRLRREIVENEKVLAFEYHRTTIRVDEDCDATLAILNVHLTRDGYPPVENPSWQRIRDIAKVTWTSAIRKAWVEAQYYSR